MSLNVVQRFDELEASRPRVPGKTRSALLLVALAWLPAAAFAQSQSAGGCLGDPDAKSDPKLPGCINEVIAAVAAPGGEVYFPAGVYSIHAPLNMRDGVNLRGEGPNATIISYVGYGGSAVSAAAPAAAPVVFRISEMQLEGSQATGAADGITLANNHRSNPLLSHVKIQSFPQYGIHFTGQDWDLSFDHVEVVTNGQRVTNGSGVFKDVAITDLNAVSFNNCVIEGNGRPDSAAGGVFLQSASTGPMKQIVFRDGVIEENKGSDQLFISYANGLLIDGVYGESSESSTATEPPDALVLFEIDHSSGLVSGTRVAIGPENTSISTYSLSIGIKVSASPNMTLNGVTYSGQWAANTSIQ